jgi:sugar phosphate isomerase/epimerase
VSRNVLLFTSLWHDFSLEELAQKVGGWGYQGLELCAGTEHLEIPRAVNEDGYCEKILELLGRYDVSVGLVSAHRTSQAVCDEIQSCHQALAPAHVWGDGAPAGVRSRAVEDMIATVRVAEKLGVRVISGFSGSAIFRRVLGYPWLAQTEIAAAYQDFGKRWAPILDACREAGVQYALEIHAGQMAFDLVTAEMALDAVDGREELGFTFDPSHFLCQGLDPVEFLRRFPDRIYHVHIKDAVLNLNGRNSLWCSYLPSGDPRRGFDFRSPGRGGVNWEAIIRTLNDIGYAGPLTVECKDPAMQRDQSAEEAYKFVKHLDFRSVNGAGGGAFRDS